jgi:exodeoxyribonuclease VII small subunit
LKLLNRKIVGVVISPGIKGYMTDSVGTSSSDRAEPPLPETWNYEATVARVETIIEQIEAGELELAEVFEQFAAAVKYLNQCEVFLQERQHRMDLLIETLTDEADF